MRLTFCGTAAGGLHVRRLTGHVCSASAILLQFEETSLLLDCGPGATRGVLAAGADVEDIAAVLVSHLHSDHVHGLPELLSHMVSGRAPMPLVLGPRGTREYVVAATEATRLVSYGGGTFGGPLPVNAEDILAEDERGVLGWTVRTVEVPHTPVLKAVARRLSGFGKTIVYSGDTTPAPRIMVPLAEGAGVLIHECFSWPGIERWLAEAPAATQVALSRGFSTTHSEVTEVARIAAEAGVATLVLTHFNPGESAAELAALAARHFAGEVIVAEDGLSIDIS